LLAVNWQKVLKTPSGNPLGPQVQINLVRNPKDEGPSTEATKHPHAPVRIEVLLTSLIYPVASDGWQTKHL